MRDACNTTVGRAAREAGLIHPVVRLGARLWQSPEPKELHICYRPNAKQSGLKLWIGALGRNVQRFLQRLLCRLIACGECVGLPEGSEKTRPVSADIGLKVSKPAPSCFDRFV